MMSEVKLKVKNLIFCLRFYGTIKVYKGQSCQRVEIVEPNPTRP